MTDQIPLLVTLLAFLSVGGIVVVLGRMVADEASIQRRLSLGPSTGQAGKGAHAGGAFVDSFLDRVDEKRFGI
jgi:hypothetical protein